MGKYIKNSYKNIFLLVLLSILFSSEINDYCSVCLHKLDGKYLVDVWENKFHDYHEHNGQYCNSCSRLISEGLTHGGYKTIDNRYICSLCYPGLIYQNTSVETSRQHVLKQLEKIGFLELPQNISIILLDKLALLNISEDAYHKNLKGFTKIRNKINSFDKYTIYILNNLHQIEFEAVLAHEYLHIWQDNFNIKINNTNSEGLCNLASGLIYDNYNNQYSKILKTTLNNDPTIYGDGYRNMLVIKNEIGWSRFIEKIKTKSFSLIK